jgi:mRNA-degrading endonuclease RelE of RelBE toxin-antitoxin system
LPHKIAVDPAFKRRLKAKSDEQRQAIKACIAKLADDPRHPGHQSRRLQSSREKVYYVRIDRGNRLTYHWDGDTIVLRNHCNHKDILGS